jgi:large subunit ribosomal protein L10
VRKKEKVKVVESLQESLQNSSVILTDYRGLTVKSITELRTSLLKLGGRMRVVKNTLLERSLTEEQQSLVQYLKGPVAATFVTGDYAAVLKEMTNFARTHPQLQFKGSWVDARAFGPQETAALATLPSREQLLGMLVAVLSSPLSGLVGTLQAVPRDLMLTLMSVAEKRGETVASA